MVLDKWRVIKRAESKERLEKFASLLVDGIMELQGEEKFSSSVKASPTKKSTETSTKSTNNTESWEDNATKFLDELGAIDNG